LAEIRDVSRNSLWSRLTLPTLSEPPGTIAEYLIQRFPQIGSDVWRDRMSRGLVVSSDGVEVTPGLPYRIGLTVLYQKEVPSEPASAEDPTILCQDSEILIADKPHGMPVTPAGEYLDRSLLVFLRKKTGLTTLAPMHRLDLETAGIVLFTINPANRGLYHGLFSDRKIEREYVAVALVPSIPDIKHWRVETGIEAGEPFFRQRIGTGGPANAITEIDLQETRDGRGFFRLQPHTGKKHQLRLHMASIGFPIVGDLLYPEIREREANTPSLQLLARRLTFLDPVSGALRTFESARSLIW
jgi:tRNA pseudouridine32 synthase/23S rRNA pseudouridine746 synthase